MFAPIVFHIEWKTGVEPVKWTPARSSWASAGSPIAAPEPYTRLITPGGSPASSYSFISQYAEYAAVDAGFQSTTFPISAALVGRFPAIAVKLNGETAKTNPSRGRYSIRFQTPRDDTGCSAYSRVMNSTLKRRKSI